MFCFLNRLEAFVTPFYHASPLDKHGDFMLALAKKTVEVAETVPELGLDVVSSRITHIL